MWPSYFSRLLGLLLPFLLACCQFLRFVLDASYPTHAAMTPTMADNANCQKWISRKIKDYDRMLHDATLTPRLEERLDQAKDVFESALKLQDTDLLSLTRGLKKLDKDVEAVYSSTFGSIERSAELLLHLTAVRGFVRALLFDDYGQNSAHSVRKSVNIHDFVITGRILSGSEGRIKVAKEYGRPEVDDPHVTATMKQRLADCAKEMLLNVEDLTTQFIEFAARKGRRRDRVQELVRACRWPELAQKLEKDRLDLSRIVPRKERIGRHSKKTWYGEIFDRITAIEHMYFNSIQSPCRPNSRARRLSEKAHASSLTIEPPVRRTQSVNDIGKLQRPLPPVPQLITSDEESEEEQAAEDKDRLEKSPDSDESPAECESPEAPPRYSDLPNTREYRAKQRRSLPGLVSRLFGSRR